MNIENNLILIKGEDKTDEISSCEYQNNKWVIRFTKAKVYRYNFNNVKWLKDPVNHDPALTVVYHRDQPLTNVNKILDFGDYVSIIFSSGYKRVYNKNELKIEINCLNNPSFKKVFDYLKQLSKKVSVINEEEINFLYNQYEKIAFISPSSVLDRYLKPSELSRPKSSYNIPIFPFGFNLSQKAATEKALCEQISIIEGPPGTGKTQTILNIIANAIMNGKTVAVVSNNNSATANVLEKLQKYDVDFIAAYLGNRENKDNFFSNQPNYPDMNTWVMNTSDYRNLKQTLEVSGKKLDEMLEIRNKVAKLKQELSDLSLQKDYFNDYYNESVEKIPPYRSLFHHHSDIIMDLWLDYEQLVKRQSNISLMYKVKNLLRYGITSFSFYKNTNEQIIALLQKLYYERKSEELEDEIQRLTQRLENYQFEKAMIEYTQNSMKLFKAKLAERFSSKIERKKFSRVSLWKEFEFFIKEYPVILSTTHSLRTCVIDNYLFDYVIMDEASQVDIVTGALALSCARNAVIVGDLRQLPNVVPADIAEETNRIYRRYGLHNAYNYVENSMLSSVASLLSNVSKTLLREHYRCHPKIISFCNQKFYNNELIIMTEENGREKPLVAYKTAKGNHARGKYNQRQIDVILEEVIPEQLNSTINKSVGIVSPYRLQTEKIRAALGKSDIQVDTIHKYQGREKDIIILTTVVNEMNEFVDNPNLVNVAVSRAVDKLILVVSDNEKNDISNIGDLIRYINYNNFEVIDSNIYSVFDLLYENYSKKLLEIMKNRNKISQYESENLMSFVIEKVLKLPEFSSLSYVIHQPLKMLIRNPDKLDDRECSYAMNILTHTDFLIFNKLDKMPVLVVEVDGYGHHSNPEQIKRDRLKDNILAKYGIAILRIKTNESGEETKLRNKLTQVLAN